MKKIDYIFVKDYDNIEAAGDTVIPAGCALVKNAELSPFYEVWDQQGEKLPRRFYNLDKLLQDGAIEKVHTQ